ncbi:uncharacterized protein [Ptychodera flava]|uniref:uncharacterized protein n=1 Tax=Ptychodera flava TaxID=63121 RepID=UPI003969CC68
MAESVELLQDINHITLDGVEEDDDEGPNARNTKCENYLRGICIDAVLDNGECRSGKHQDTFPSGSAWAPWTLRMLNFRPIHMVAKEDISAAIQDWLYFFPVSQVQVQLCGNFSTEVGDMFRETVTASQEAHFKLPRLSRQELEPSEDDGFMIFLKKFLKLVRDPKDHELDYLIQMSMKVDVRDIHPTQATIHRNTILSWIRAMKMSSVKEAFLDDFFHALAISVGAEINLSMLIKVRETCTHDVTICEKRVRAIGGVEVRGVVNNIMRTTCLSKNTIGTSCGTIPQMAAEALTVAKFSAFGNDISRIVYHLSIQMDKSSSGSYISMARTHVAMSTLERAASSPIQNPLEPSLIFHSSVPATDFRTKRGIKALYKALRGVCLAHKKLNELVQL